MKAFEDKMHLYKHFIKVLSKLLYMSILQLLTLNFGTVLELDKQNELKTSEVNANKMIVKLIN